MSVRRSVDPLFFELSRNGIELLEKPDTAKRLQKKNKQKQPNLQKTCEQPAIHLQPICNKQPAFKCGFISLCDYIIVPSLRRIFVHTSCFFFKFQSACPEPKPCGECDVVVVKKDDCNCAGRKCIETFPEDHKCPKGEKLKLIAAAPCQKKHVCVPVTPPCKESPKPKCTQCEESVISQAPVFVDEEGKEGKVTFCDKWACEYVLI